MSCIWQARRGGIKNGFWVPGLSRYIDESTVVQMTDSGRRPSLGGKIMNLVLGISNVQCFWQSEGKCHVSSYMSRTGSFQSQSSENIMFRMEVVDFEQED